MSKTYITRQKVTLILELMTDADSLEELHENLKKGKWDGQFMYESNDFTDVIKVEDIEVLEIIEDD